jgi:transposase
VDTSTLGLTSPTRRCTVPQKYSRPFAPEFRSEAVRLVRESGRAVKDVAQSLGVSQESLRLWLKQSDLDTGLRKDGLTSDERKELVRLRREDREILKKAAAFFARESDPIR